MRVAQLVVLQSGCQPRTFLATGLRPEGAGAGAPPVLALASSSAAGSGLICCELAAARLPSCPKRCRPGRVGEGVGERVLP